MSEKSHVSMEQNVCPVCAQAFDTGAILLDTRLRQRLEHRTVTGWGVCPACKEKDESGYIALIEAREPATPIKPERMKPEDADRTGRIFHVRREVAARMFAGFDVSIPMVFIDTEVGDMLAAEFARIEATE
jgi:hypothetical protein